ncbi:MCE family protein [Nocardia neocaledoniensis]|uniref:MCE family protein n=1 Tax=Nocardia neocaledoniensis TaxID=236511 RepID=UPI0024550418|nr:MCE family protein [Nocardia neocaledoniensis]
MRRGGFRAAVLVALTVAGSGCSSIPITLRPDTMRISADFESAAGLFVGNEVAVLGVPVGRVDAIEQRGAFVEVRMTIEEGTELPAEAMAALVSPQLITNRHVELTPGYTGEGPTLTDGAHIPLARTRTPVELDRILRNFEQLGASLKGDNTDGPMASRVLFPLLDGNGDRIRETLDALAGAFEVTLANRDQITSTIVELNELTAVVAGNDQTVRDFSARLTELVTLLAEQAPGLAAALAQINDFVANTSTVLTENRAPLTDAVTRLVGITAQMRDNARGLTEIVDVAPLLFENLSRSVSTEHQAMRLHLLTDKSLLDNEILSTLCARLALRADGCRTGKLMDFGPDFGLTAALLGLTE